MPRSTYAVIPDLLSHNASASIRHHSFSLTLPHLYILGNHSTLTLDTVVCSTSDPLLLSSRAASTQHGAICNPSFGSTSARTSARPQLRCSRSNGTGLASRTPHPIPYVRIGIEYSYMYTHYDAARTRTASEPKPSDKRARPSSATPATDPPRPRPQPA